MRYPGTGSRVQLTWTFLKDLDTIQQNSKVGIAMATLIPIIDIGPFDKGTDIVRARIAKEIDTACRDTGFFSITGHKVNEDIMSETRKMAAQFFSLPVREKLLVERPPQKISRGYNKFQDRSLAYSIGEEAPPDLQEAFAFGPEEFDGSDWIADKPETAMLAPNRWPVNPTEFRSTMLAYDAEMRALGDRMLDILAVALATDREYFRTKFDKQSSVGRMVRYPALITEPKLGQLRAGAHTDYGVLTFLRGDNVPGGTQVKMKDGSWLNVNPPPDGFLCNIGDALARWTNDLWVSTLHRVSNPPRLEGSRDRISMVYFHSPNHDAEIECLSSCAKDRLPKYPPVSFADHYLGKVMKAAHARKDANIEDARAGTEAISP